MAEYLNLDILTPNGRVDLRLVEGGSPERSISTIPVEAVDLPAALGEMGVRPGHIPFLTPVVPGVVRFRFEGEDRRLAVGTGFLEISGDGTVTLLTSRVQRSWEVDVAAVREELATIDEELEKRASAPIDDAEVVKLKDRRAWLDAQLEAAKAA
ncbi:F0F1 ATP synthase subunit epsilon [Pseudenhygromyxa sp. WMMC2535]|uniref:F0F1 ATP synthase subunit epsilon n=1 Tax=Pseudenhygromyxa sp. WMMC2535 TaxID=2712867 RepID=UPI0015524584|nr:F0F1 ATP synthase subunit epsilon [Pseudenhygromyxa sp. WMMC2535]NVB40107.1 F0F1 ATP synthase subunit epsilon [Pseudenhygromyxa sp. WMMC2535]